MAEKRKRVVLGLSQKIEVVNRLRQGESATSIASVYGIGRTTVNDIKRDADKIENYVSKMETADGNVKSRKTMKHAKNEELDTAMYQWFVQKRRQGISLSGSVIIEKAIEINRELGGDPSFKASTGWLEKFKFRHGIRHLSMEEFEADNMTSHTDDQEAMMAAFEKEAENSQDSITEMQVKEEPEDTGYEQASAASVPSDHNSNTDSRNSSPLPPVQFENSSPAETRNSSPVLNQGSSIPQSSPQIPLNDLFAGSTIRSQLQGAIAGKKMDAVQNIVEGLLKKNETLLAMSDAGGFKPNARRARAAHDGFVKRSEPAFPTPGQSSVFPVSHTLQARINASKKTSDTLTQHMIRPKSPTRRHDGLLKDKTHFSYAMMESCANDHEIEEIFSVQNHELVCAIGSKSFLTDQNNKVVASLEFTYYWCNYCPFSSNNKTLLIQHVIEHRFCCKYCPYESFCRSDILRHMNKMHEDFQYTAGMLSYCTLLSDYMRVKARVDGKENKDPDEDVDDLDPKEMEATLQRTAGRKRKIDEDENEIIPSEIKSPKVDLEEDSCKDVSEAQRNCSKKDRSGKSRKSLNPKRHPPPRESDYDVFDMEVEEISEPQQNALPDDSESDRILYSSSQASPNPYSKGKDNQSYMPRIISAVSASSMQSYIHSPLPNPPISKSARNSYAPNRGRPYKGRSSGSSSLYWSCGYCSFQSNSQAEIKEHSNKEHPGKPHRYVALIKNMTPDSIVHKSPRGNTSRYSSSKQLVSDSSTPVRSASQSPQIQSSFGASSSPQASTDSKANGEDDTEEAEDIVSLKEKADSSSLLKVKLSTIRVHKKENTVFRCYHCSYTAKRHSAMKSHIYYKHRGKGLVAVDENSSIGQQIFFCARDDCTFKSESAMLYLNHVDQCTPWNKPELADVEVEPHIRECLEQTITFAEMAREKRDRGMLSMDSICRLGKVCYAVQDSDRRRLREKSSSFDFRSSRKYSKPSPAQKEETDFESSEASLIESETEDHSENAEPVVYESYVRKGLNQIHVVCECNTNDHRDDDVNNSKCMQMTTDADCERSMGLGNDCKTFLVQDKSLVLTEPEDEFEGTSDKVEEWLVIPNEHFYSETESCEGGNKDNMGECDKYSEILSHSVCSEDNFIPVGIVDLLPEVIVAENYVNDSITFATTSDQVIKPETQETAGLHYASDIESHESCQSEKDKEVNLPLDNFSDKNYCSSLLAAQNNGMNKAAAIVCEKSMSPELPELICMTKEAAIKHSSDQKLNMKASSSSLKLKFRTVGDTTVCSISSPHAQACQRHSEVEGKSESSNHVTDTSEDEEDESSAHYDSFKTTELQDPKWLEDLIDSSIESDSDATSDCDSALQSKSSIGNTGKNIAESVLSSDAVSRDHSHINLNENTTTEPTNQEMLCFSYVPARSAAVKALTKMKPTFEFDISFGDEDSDADDIKIKNVHAKPKLHGTKSDIPSSHKIANNSNIKSSVTAKSFSSHTSKKCSLAMTTKKARQPVYMCKYCDFGLGPVRKIKLHVLSKHSSMPAVVIDSHKQKQHFYICPCECCYKLSGSKEELEVHKLTHKSLKLHPSRHKEQTKLKSLSSSENCSSLMVGGKVQDSKKRSDSFENLPPCRVELNMLDLKKLKPVSLKQEEKYACLYCTENYSNNSLSAMKSHYGAEHEGQLMVMRDTEARRAQLPSRIYVCDNPSCDSYYISRSDLDNHAKSHESNFTYMYECGSCGWYSASLSAANAHLKINHADEDSVSLVHMQVSIDQFGQTSKRIL